MKISRDEAFWVAKVLTKQAESHRELLGDCGALAPVFEKLAAAFTKGETIEVERKRKA